MTSTQHTDNPTTGVLYIIGTPIGNSKDITLRALEMLRGVDVLCAEDTRVVGKLLKIHEIPHKKLISVNEFADTRKIQEIISLLQEGKQVAFVSDAGTPGISDPGGLLVSAARDASIQIVPIPGVSAVTTILSVSGIRETPFVFYGFLPHKKGRQKILDTLLEQQGTVVLYESPHRFMKLLTELSERDSAEAPLQVTVGRELTKIYEEVRQGGVSELIDHYTEHEDTVRGEFVLIIRKTQL